MASLVHATPFEIFSIWVVLGIALLGLAYALMLRAQTLRRDKGSQRMQEVWNGIRTGADTYLTGQAKKILPSIFVLAFVLFFSVYIVPPSPEALERFRGQSPGSVRIIIGLGRSAAFVMGALFSMLVGQFGMRMAVQGNVRVAAVPGQAFPKRLKSPTGPEPLQGC
jgi:K(+)-stimulated pyrophosphate-energized sodium pump